MGTDAAADATHRHHLEQVSHLVDELRAEEPPLVDAALAPVLAAVAACVPAHLRRSGPRDLDCADIEARMSAADAAAIYDHLTDKVTEFAAERVDPASAGSEAMEDVDLFCCEGEELVVNAKWLRHLEQRAMGDGGKICRCTADGLEGEEPASSRNPAVPLSPAVDCPAGGLVLDWAYGKIVNTAEKARGGAQALLGAAAIPLPLADLAAAAAGAWAELLRGCGEHATLLEQRTSAKALLADVLRARLAAETAASDASPLPPGAPTILITAAPSVEPTLARASYDMTPYQSIR
jgi:hypothetical protein